MVKNFRFSLVFYVSFRGKNDKIQGWNLWNMREFLFLVWITSMTIENPFQRSHVDHVNQIFGGFYPYEWIYLIYITIDFSIYTWLMNEIPIGIWPAWLYTYIYIYIKDFFTEINLFREKWWKETINFDIYRSDSMSIFKTFSMYRSSSIMSFI